MIICFSSVNNQVSDEYQLSVTCQHLSLLQLRGQSTRHLSLLRSIHFSFRHRLGRLSRLPEPFRRLARRSLLSRWAIRRWISSGGCFWERMAFKRRKRSEFRQRSSVLHEPGYACEREQRNSEETWKRCGDVFVCHVWWESEESWDWEEFWCVFPKQTAEISDHILRCEGGWVMILMWKKWKIIRNHLRFLWMFEFGRGIYICT